MRTRRSKRKRARRSRANEQKRRSHPSFLRQPAESLPAAIPHAIGPPLCLPTTLPRSYEPPKHLLSNAQTHASLAQSQNVLYLLHVRNRNQHRRSPAYRSFSIFRRELRALLSDLSVDTISHRPSTSTPLAQLGGPKVLGARKADVQARISFWLQADLVAKWYLAFSTLLAPESVRFAQLGLVLLGLLGRVCRDTGVTGWLDKVAEEQQHKNMISMLEKFATKEWDGAKGVGGEDSEEDLGILVGTEGR